MADAVAVAGEVFVGEARSIGERIGLVEALEREGWRMAERSEGRRGAGGWSLRRTERSVARRWEVGLASGSSGVWRLSGRG